MTAHIEVILDTGERLIWDTDDLRVITGRQIRRAACCRRLPSECKAVHRELVGRPRLRISAVGDGGWG